VGRINICPMKVCFRFALYLVNFRRRCYRLRRTPKILPKLKFKPRCLCFMANIADAALCYIRRVLFQTGCVYSANLFFTFTSLHLKTDQNVALTRNCLTYCQDFTFKIFLFPFFCVYLTSLPHESPFTSLSTLNIF
jgi:hypothetical protein